MNSVVDQLFEQITTEKPGVGDLGVRIAMLNMYDGLGSHIHEVRQRIDEAGEDAILQESLDRNVSLYQKLTGVEPLPNDKRGELIERLSRTFHERHDAWTQTPEFAEQQRQIADFLD